MFNSMILFMFFFFFQAEDGIRDAQESRGLGDVYKRQPLPQTSPSSLSRRLRDQLLHSPPVASFSHTFHKASPPPPSENVEAEPAAFRPPLATGGASALLERAYSDSSPTAPVVAVSPVRHVETQPSRPPVNLENMIAGLRKDVSEHIEASTNKLGLSPEQRLPR
eukprot:TRINITY_DN45950_c0_g1_i1.p1 TRINITY_DN45950_c0_g1~~TRINITY_DN45950_c0_g1_i1.p1  ORF type:complete len:165 (-),score=29.14 TRINITY_DN45950_c0_g1_i1:54-548(-)